MTNSEIFKAAHKLTKETIQTGDSYSATFGLCLAFIYANGIESKAVSLAEFITAGMKDSSYKSWNRKFYQKNDNTVEIYLNGVKTDITNRFNAELRADGYFYRSDFDALFNPIISDMEDAELDAL